MSTISATAVKELREMSGAGMMDCKKALTEASGNIEDAIDILRKTGIAKARKNLIGQLKKVLYSHIFIPDQN